jgi:hypothetical protein
MGAAMVIGCSVPMVEGVFSLSWPLVDGVITHSRDLPGRRAIGVDIGYRYAVGGRTYTGGRFRFQFWLTSSSMDSRDVQSILGRYRVGEPVKVAVNPRDAADSVLQPGPDFGSVLFGGFGLVLLLLGVGQPSKDKPVGLRYGWAKILALAGAALFALGAINLYRGIDSMRWPSADGRILYSHARSASRPETLLWYEYYVANRRYVASMYRNGGNVTPFATVAKAAAKRYPVGRVVAVYYDPRNPQNALLEPGLWWGNFVAPAFSMVLFGMAWLAKKYVDVMAERGQRRETLPRD